MNKLVKKGKRAKKKVAHHINDKLSEIKFILATAILTSSVADDNLGPKGEYEVERIVEHVHGTERGTELRVRFKGYSPEHDLWYAREDLEGMCKEKVDLYIAENEPEFTNSLITNETAAVIDMVRDMNRMAAETTTYQLKNGLPSDEEVVAMAALGTSMQTSIKGPD